MCGICRILGEKMSYNYCQNIDDFTLGVKEKKDRLVL